MTYFLAALIVIWVCGLLFFSGQHLNDIRVVLNNLAPGPPLSESPPSRPERKLLMAAGTLLLFPSYLEIIYLAAMLLLARLFKFDPTKSYSLVNIDPARLNEAGRNHLKKASRHQLIALAWAIVGMVLITWISYSNS